MRQTQLILIAFIAACAPTIVEKTDEGATGSTVPGEGEGEGEAGGEGEGEGEVGGEGEGEGEGEADPPEPTLASGEWAPSDAALTSDPCDWVAVLDEYYDSEILDWLPTEFEVEGEEGSFQIEAQDYGAQGPITCTITDGQFTCEQQDVEPTYADLGYYGWEYEVDFSGEVIDENTIRGTAVVRYPSVDESTAYWLGTAGIESTDCDQTFELELSFDD